MILPSEYAWFEPVLIAAIIVFIIDAIGSTIVFSRRPVLNALASAILFAVIFGVLVYYGYGRVEMSVSTTPEPGAPAQTPSTSPTPAPSTAPAPTSP
jgi:hypothetical protein